MVNIFFLPFSEAIDHQKEVLMKQCVKNSEKTEEVCKILLSNGIATMCEHMVNYQPCKNSQHKLATTSTTTTTTTTTTVATITKDNSFPFASTMGGFLIGAAVAVVLILFISCILKRKGKKQEGDATTTGETKKHKKNKKNKKGKTTGTTSKDGTTGTGSFGTGNTTTGTTQKTKKKKAKKTKKAKKGKKGKKQTTTGTASSGI
ncbi:hypothetical protein B9Z55_021986 [Caenorhabditis nigoni]|uniref:Uncharacterized protein n=2 Tax=Caenorhabditis nigoni TaxID=1611254 RepID=A0A2G5TUB1_9PELO|nr:hypothetical protein B9Z55_021986 [Caenorhabditis nigoni]